MTYLAIAKLMGISSGGVRLIERRALEKLARCFGVELPPRPAWMQSFKRGAYRPREKKS